MTGSLIPVPVEDPLRLAWYECNDAGNAKRLRELAKGRLLWVDDKAWLAFDGKRWSQEEGNFRAGALALEVALHIHDEAAALGALIGDHKAPNAAALLERFGDWCAPQLAIDRLAMLHKHAIRSGDANRTAAMLAQSKLLPELRARSADFDRDPLTFNVQNGTLRFLEDDDRKWKVRFQDGHEPGDMLMQIAGVDYDPDAECPQWLERLADVQPDDEQRGVLAMLYGQSVTGLTDGEEFYTHQGQGGDGKSKTHEVLAAIFGDYFRHSPVKTWLAATIQKSGSEHRSDLVRLKGDVRFVISEEPPRNAMWDSEVLKQATGGGSITARGSNERTEITFKPRFKLHVEVNKFPAAPSDDRGWWRRQFPVSWPCDTSTLPGGAEPPAKLMARLSAENSGILNWLIAGCLEWLPLRKLPRPAVVEAAIASQKSLASPIAEWLAEACDLSDRTAREEATALYNRFKEWCEANGVDKVPTQRRFGDGLTDRQIYVDRNRSGRKVRCGIRLRGKDPLLEDDGGGSVDGVDQASPIARAPDERWQDNADPFGGGWPE